MFITNLRDKTDPLLIDLSCTQFYIRLHFLNIFKYLSNISRTCLKLLLFSFVKNLSCYVYGGFRGEVEYRGW
jgi:hypothetical protein